MKLAILNITAGGFSGGHKKYLRNILERFATNDKIGKILITIPKGSSIESYSKFSKITVEEVRPYSLSNAELNNELHELLDNFLPDVVYVPVERYFVYEKAPVVMMLQNMEPFICPFDGNPLSEKIKNGLRFINAKKALRNADRIIAISEFVKDYLINRVRINPLKIGLVYHGANQNKNVNDDTQKPASIPSAIGSFLFTAGSIRPARGLEDVIHAMKQLEKQNVRVTLIIAGAVEPSMVRYQKRIQTSIALNKLSSKIIWAGNLSAREITWCYQNCSVFVMTSRVESFGLIALEAMTYGCICISSNNPCLPEIFGDAAVYYQAGNSEDLSLQIKHVLSWDESVRNSASERAYARASAFNWDICGNETIEQFEIAIEEFKRKRNGFEQ